jgi:hypothetical protein
MRLLPTWTSQGTLLGAAALDFGSASDSERKNLLFMQLYYSETNPEMFRNFLLPHAARSYMDFYAPSVMFGDERFLPIFSRYPNPIQPNEIDEALAAYKLYVESFSRRNASEHPLTYLIICGQEGTDLPHIDLWYRREETETFGSCRLSHLILRS